jgi:hypothetical protein
MSVFYDRPSGYNEILPLHGIAHGRSSFYWVHYLNAQYYKLAHVTVILEIRRRRGGRVWEIG